MFGAGVHGICEFVRSPLFSVAAERPAGTPTPTLESRWTGGEVGKVVPIVHAGCVDCEFGQTGRRLAWPIMLYTTSRNQ